MFYKVDGGQCTVRGDILLYIIGVVWALTACTTSSTPSAVQPGNRYATGFTIREYKDSVSVVIYCPWEKDKEMAQYTIVAPYSRLASNSCTHIGFLHELDALRLLAGITNPELVYTPLSDGVADIGESMAPDMERIMLLAPDAVLLSTYAEGDETPQRLQRLHIPVFFINEWNESTPLGRAEWIRVIGAITGHLHEADSIFDAVVAAYNRQQADTLSALSVVSGQDFRGTWYVPAGGTFMGHLFADAGLRYRYADDMRDTSIPLHTEQALRDFQSADIWLGVQARTLAELAQIDEKHTWFKPYQTGRVYHFMHRATPTGGNDFWESGVVHPERILNDLRLIQSDEAQDSLFYTGQLR